MISKSPLTTYEDIKESVIDLLDSTSKKKQEFIFVTGPAGTGKSTLIEDVKKEVDKNKIVVAPTGIAALNIGGKTIHSVFRLGFEPIPPVKEYKDPKFRKLIKNLEILIIDEISMVKAPILDAISRSLQLHRKSKKPFGGVSVLVCGDLFQLPPVMNQYDEKIILDLYESPFFFDAACFYETQEPKIFELTESFRQQDDSHFLDLLNNIRLGLNLQETVNTINRTCFDPQFEEETAMTVTSRTRRSEDLNKHQLQLIEDQEKEFKARERGEFKESELPAPRELVLKKGAQVIFTKNDSEGRWVNGSIGKVLDVSSKKQIEVKIQNISYKVEREKWVKESYIYDEINDEIHTEEVAVYEQFPLKLGWSVTIHKSQGLTLESCSVDLGNGAFAPGQAYVALSRCKNLNSLHLHTELKASDIKLDPQVVDFYKYICSTKH